MSVTALICVKRITGQKSGCSTQFFGPFPTIEAAGGALERSGWQATDGDLSRWQPTSVDLRQAGFCARVELQSDEFDPPEKLLSGR